MPDPLAPIQISATEFKARCLELMDNVAERRISYVVTKRGVPVAELVPTGAGSASPIGHMRGMVAETGDVIGPDHEAWAASDSDPLDRQ